MKLNLDGKIPYIFLLFFLHKVFNVSISDGCCCILQSLC